jgi:hypothetical protein
LHSLWGIEIQRDYGEACYTLGCVWYDGAWKSVEELWQVEYAASHVSLVLGGFDKFQHALHSPIGIRRTSTNPWGTPYTYDSFSAFFVGFDIWLPDSTFSSPEYAQYSIIHEFGHVWDFRTGNRLSNGLSAEMGTTICELIAYPVLGISCECQFDPTAAKEPPPGNPADLYAYTNAKEDWAEAFMAYIYPSYYNPAAGYNDLGPLRRQYVEEQIRSIP